MQLNKREKISLSIGVLFLLGFIALELIVFPLVDKRSRLAKSLVVREKEVVDMRIMQERYQVLRKQSGSLTSLLAKREGGFSLFSFLEKNAASSQVKEHIVYMKPSGSPKNELFKQSLVEMKLQAISLKQLVAFLEKTESSENLVGINKITIQENTKEAATLDVTLQMVSVDQAAGATSQ